MQEAAQYRLHLLNDLRLALAAGQFQLFFQPIIELSTGKLRKAEALLRWFHPQRGLISPAEFIPLAEDSGLIHEIGDWVFSESVRNVLQWRAKYVADFQVSVNMSPREIQARIRQAEWQRQLTLSGLPGQAIVVEITEGLLLDTSSHVTSQLLAFRDAGVQVAIDDFGTGYSALSYLKKLDIDYVKIDQSFIRALVTDKSDLALTEAMIVMAHKLGLQVIAEGVETPQQRDLLATMGCDFVQGYLYSRPVPAAEFEYLLIESART
jgi:EAL domain-containing protein (putative c-di-GMP-specific phosphodiesterase class I)